MRVRIFVPAILAAGLLLVGCGNDTFGTGQKAGQGGGPVTGIILNAQGVSSAKLMTVQPEWKVVDPAGTVIFSKSQVGGPYGAQFTLNRSEMKKVWTGTNPKEFNVQKVTFTSKKIGTAKKGETAPLAWSASIVVDDAAAAELRGLKDDLTNILQRGRVTVLCSNH